MQSYDRLFLTKDGGNTWKDLFVPFQHIRGSQFVSSRILWVIGDGYESALSIDGGDEWNRISLPEPDSAIPGEISAFDGNTAWIASFDKLYGTTDAGASWHELGKIDSSKNNSSFSIRGVEIISPDSGMVLGWNGLEFSFYTTGDSGKSWTKDPAFPEMRDDIKCLHKTSEGNIWMVGKFGMILTNQEKFVRVANPSNVRALSRRGSASGGSRFLNVQGRSIKSTIVKKSPTILFSRTPGSNVSIIPPNSCARKAAK